MEPSYSKNLCLRFCSLLTGFGLDVSECDTSSASARQKNSACKGETMIIIIIIIIIVVVVVVVIITIMDFNFSKSTLSSP